MFPRMNSVIAAKRLKIDSAIALSRSKRAREAYIQGMKDGLCDDDLRHLHHDAMDASAVAVRAHNITLGQRKYQYQDMIG